MSKMCPYFVRRKEGVRFGGVFLGSPKKKGGEEATPLKMYAKNSRRHQEKKKGVCIHSLVIRARFGGIQMDTTAVDDDDEREKDGSAKETLEKSTLRVVQRELESVPSSTKAANGKVKPTLTTTKIIAFLSQVVSSFCIRAPPRETGTRETHFAARAFFCFAFVFLLSQVYKRRGNVFYLSTKEELLRETKEKLAEMSE